MSYYPLLEEVRKSGEGKAVRDKLVSVFSGKYGTHSENTRVKNSGNVEASELAEDIKEVLKNLELEFEKVEIIPPGRAASPKAKSDSFDTVHVTLSDPTRKDFGIVLASLAGRGKTSTIFKEGMVCFFFSSPNEYEPFSKMGADSKENYSQLMEAIYNDIDKNGIEGLSDKNVKEIQDFILGKSEYDLNTLNSAFNSMSIGNYLRHHPNLGSWTINMDDLFDKVKSAGKTITGLPADKWNPMDIMLIKPGSEDEIASKVDEALAEDNKDRALAILNGLFMDSLDSKNPESLIVAISLKEQISQAGKAKSFVDSLDISGDEYNLTAEEKAWLGNEKKLRREIGIIRSEMKEFINTNLSKKIDYKVEEPLNGFGVKAKNPVNYMGKYGSLKMIYFLVQQMHKDQDLFVDIASYGLSLGVNPTFYKFVGNIMGDEKQVGNKIEEFEARGGVKMYDTPDKDYDKKIWILDRNTNSGVRAIYWVVFGSWVYVVFIDIRSNKAEQQVTQVAIEIKKFEKKKDLR